MDTENEAVQIPGEYFNTVISEVIDQSNIKDHEIRVSAASGKGENYIGLLYRIIVTGIKENGEETKLDMVMKIPPQSEILREKFPIGTVYIREVFVYKTLLPKFCGLQDTFNIPDAEKFKFVKCFRAESENFKEFILLQDVCANGYKMANRRTSLEYKHLILVLKTLARFHALSFVLKKVDPGAFEDLAKNVGSMLDFSPEFNYFIELCKNRGIEALDDAVMIEKASAFGTDVMKTIDGFINPDYVKPYSVLCHGDCWNNNFMFKFQDEEPIDVVLLDWQISRNCSPVTDIAYLMFSSTDYDLRKEHFQDLMKFYHDSLAKSLSYMDCDIDDHYPRAVFEDHLKRILPYGLLMSFMLLPAVLGEAEDVPDMDAMLLKDKIDQSDLKFENKQSSNRYQVRMRGVVKTFIEMDLI